MPASAKAVRISVSWADNTPDSYSAELRIVSSDRSGFIMDAATVLNTLNAKVRSLSARDTGRGLATASVMLEVKNLAELQTIINRLGAINGVKRVYRTGEAT